jgi:hypothetical protein
LDIGSWLIPLFLFFYFFEINQKNNVLDIDCPPIQCAYQAFIIQNLDVMTRTWYIAKFGNFGQTNLIIILAAQKATLIEKLY